VAVDPHTKKILWKHDEQDYLDSRSFCMTGGRIYFYSPERFLGCLDAKTGKMLWKTSDPDLLKAIGPSGPAWFRGEWGFATASFLKCNERYLFFSGPQRPNFVIASAEDGKLLYQQKGGYLHLVLRDDAFYARSMRPARDFAQPPKRVPRSPTTRGKRWPACQYVAAARVPRPARTASSTGPEKGHGRSAPATCN
jgi:hypothetical protein